MSKGTVIYEGKSLIDDSPIVVIATVSSKNRKTGNMVQTWIIRSDMNPIDAVQSGKDSAICGDCVHRGHTHNGKNRSCYVTYFQAPSNIYKSYKEGKYSKNDFSIFNSRVVRLGSYGDPAAVPYEIWLNVLKTAKGHTGYTHQWKKCSQNYSNILMASVDNEKEYYLAKEMGYRTFRVKGEKDDVLEKEISCPASKEMNYISSCEKCKLCSGTRFGKINKNVKDIVINAHGNKGMVSMYNKFVNLTVSV